MLNKRITYYLQQKTKAAPLAVFRILFGLMMFVSVVRFWLNGWIEKLYIEPTFFFSYYGFEWVKPIGNYTYLLFIVCGIAALLVAFGYKYRLAIITFFLSFTYIELMDKTTYLNHYYFISLMAFILIFLPANAYFSVDAKLGKSHTYIPKWCIDAVRLMLGIVYFYAGLAKLNSDWLLHALPLQIWLPGRYDLPIIGGLLEKEWVSYAFSWFGALYDLSIPFLLFNKKTRWFAFVAVVVFHILTRILFPIGMFPYIMMASSLIFFSASFHEKIIQYLSKIFKIQPLSQSSEMLFQHKWKPVVLAVFFSFQLLLPFRYLAYPDELFWTEEGFRFSWRVMLVEKVGYTQFKITKPDGKWFYVQNDDFLTPFQEKQMSFQPDFILEYAHYLGNHFEKQGHGKVEVSVESYVTLNGRESMPFIDPTVNLRAQKEGFKHKKWILPFDTNEIYGIN